MTFKCAAIGKPAPRIWWVRNGEDLLEGNTLRFVANRSHSGKYWCLADNGLSEALNASAYLDVLCEYEKNKIQKDIFANKLS